MTLRTEQLPILTLCFGKIGKEVGVNGRHQP